MAVADFVAQMATSLMCLERSWSIMIGCKKSNMLLIFMLLKASMYNIWSLCSDDSEKAYGVIHNLMLRAYSSNIYSNFSDVLYNFFFFFFILHGRL